MRFNKYKSNLRVQKGHRENYCSAGLYQIILCLQMLRKFISNFAHLSIGKKQCNVKKVPSAVYAFF